jgi:hypothetical protein
LEAGRRQQLCNRSLQRQSRLHRVGAGCYPESVAPKIVGIQSLMPSV